MKTTRQRILEYLHLRRTATIEDFSRVLHFTQANIRHHIKQLVEEGLVVEVGKRPADGRGRPFSLFSLSEHITSHNLDNLASAALETIFSDSQDPEGDDLHIQKLAAILAKKELVTGGSPSKRLLHAVQRLNEMNYQARWEAHDEGPRVIFNHCPYASILNDHPELCRMDVHLLQEMMGVAATLKTRFEPGPTGLPMCVFILEKTR
jgi:predicted ArsR family transcriptional regulator